MACASSRFCCSASSSPQFLLRLRPLGQNPLQFGTPSRESSAAYFSAAARRSDSSLTAIRPVSALSLVTLSVLGLDFRDHRLRGCQFLGPRRQDWPDRFVASSWPERPTALPAPLVPRATCPAPAFAGRRYYPVRHAGLQFPPPVSRWPPRRPDSVFQRFGQLSPLPWSRWRVGVCCSFTAGCAASNSFIFAIRPACSVCWLLACVSSRFCCSASSARNCSCACVR